MERGSRVFIIQKRSHVNVMDAAQYGELVHILPEEHNVDDNNTTPLLEDGLREFNPEEDFLLLLGDPAAIGIATACIARRFNSYTLLKWDRQNSVYFTLYVQHKEMV